MNTPVPVYPSALESEAESPSWISPASFDVLDADDPELNIICRTKTSLAAVPDIISMVFPLLVIDFQTIELNFIINPDHRFVPGEAPASCSTSVDDIVWLPARSSNVFQVVFPAKAELAAQNRLRATVKFSRFGVPIVVGFRLKYREGPGRPRLARKAVLLATVMPGARNVTLTKG